MIKKHKWKLIISSIITILPAVFGLILWERLPELFAVHWGIDGEPDGLNSKKIAIFLVPVFMLAVHWICIFFTERDPENKEQSSKVFNMLFWILPITSLIVSVQFYALVLESDMNVFIMMRLLMGIIFLVLGNYMPKCKKNHTIGVKVAWTLGNEENWNKTHRFTGRLWVFGGIFFLVTMWMPMKYFVYLFVPMLLILSFAPMFYSYLYYKKQIKMKTVTKEEITLTPTEKKTSKIAMVIGISILIFAGVVLFTGKYEIGFEEELFTIKATYWDDATINYEDIETLEYREEKVPGVRTFGYGTPFMVMGECENNEFGVYTGYVYNSCDACVVLTVKGKVLVINGKNEESTKAIYEQLTERMKK